MQRKEVMGGYFENRTEHIKTIFEKCVVSGFRLEMDKNCITTQKNTFVGLSKGRVTLRLTVGWSVGQSWCRSPPWVYVKILKWIGDTAPKGGGKTAVNL